MAYVNLSGGGGLGRIDRNQRVRSLMPAGRPRGFGAIPPAAIPPHVLLAILQANRARRGLGAYATGICEGGSDTGDGSPCTPAVPGAQGGISAEALASMNAGLNPGVKPITVQDIINEGIDAQNYQLNSGGGGPVPVRMNVGPLQQPTFQSSSGQAPASGGQIQIQDNVTGSSSVLTAGNPYTLRITGATPGLPVSVTVNGNWASAQGTTDAQGNFTLNGITPGTPQSQSQQWTVGGQATSPGTITFAIVANPNQPTGTAAAAGTGPVAGSSSASGILSALTGSVSLFGFNIPIWALGAAGVGAVMLASGGGKHR